VPSPARPDSVTALPAGFVVCRASPADVVALAACVARLTPRELRSERRRARFVDARTAAAVVLSERGSTEEAIAAAIGRTQGTVSYLLAGRGRKGGAA
jgi:4'-phosphopantetheinyl transferase EntD